jgi:hypothetical protein
MFNCPENKGFSQRRKVRQVNNSFFASFAPWRETDFHFLRYARGAMRNCLEKYQVQELPVFNPLITDYRPLPSAPAS